MRTLRLTLALLGIVVVSAPADASVLKRIFGEEFGATWCTYCPRARCALTDLDTSYGPQFLHVETHVSGSDPFNTAETTARASRYGVSGIPHVMIDGKYPFIGADLCPIMIDAYQEPIESQISDWTYLSPVDITGGMQIVGNQATLTARFTLVDPGFSFTNHQAVLYIYENDVTWCCGYGGVSHWDEVVRMVRTTPVSLTTQGQEVQVVQTLTIGGQSVPINPAKLHAVAVYEQIGGTKETIQATDFTPFANFFVPSFTDRLEALPNGNGIAQFVGTVQNVADNLDVVDLSISGFVGNWNVEFQVEGDSNWYTEYTLPLAGGESAQVTMRVQTDGELLIGQGSLVADSQTSGQHHEVVFQVFNGSRAVLLVDDDGASTYETDFQTGLTSGGYLYNMVSVESGQSGPSAQDLAQYDAVIWQTGFGMVTLTPEDIAALTTYINNGGGLFLQAMEYLSVNGANPFTQNYLGVASYVNNAKADAATGVSGDPITDGMSFPALEWPAPAYNKADVVNPIANATAIFHKQTAEPIAVRYERPNGARTVFNTVLLTAFGNGASPNNKTQVVVRTMDWILGGEDPSDAPVAQLPAPGVSQIMAASPNPFSPSTELRFALSNSAAQEPVKLVLIDAAGRQVRTLVDGTLDAGWHNVGWDGRDESGRQSPSGIYFAVLRSADGSSSSKLTRLE